MAEPAVLYERHQRVALITLHRPERMNAWTLAMEDEYVEQLQRAEADPAVRAIVVTGAGRAFCAGADMADLADLGDGTSSLRDADRRAAHWPMSVRKPTVAAINGAAAGVGLAQALFLDQRLVEEGTKLTFSFARRGLIAEYGTSWLLPRLVGTSRAFDLLVSSRVVLADEALAMGLVDRVAAKGETVEAGLAYASNLAEMCSPASMAMIKQQLLGDWGRTLDQAVARSWALMVQSTAGPDLAEGVASYVEGRPPQFPNLDEGTGFGVDP